MTEDLKRAREYGDAFRKYLLTALTGGIGILLSVAGALVGKGVSPGWVAFPITVFGVGLVAVGCGLLMGEHRSILRRRDPNAQSALPWYKTGIAWNLFGLFVLLLAIAASTYALNGIELPSEKQGEIEKFWVRLDCSCGSGRIIRSAWPLSWLQQIDVNT